MRTWRQAANPDPSKRAAALILRVAAAARQVSLAAGGDFVANKDGAGRILSVLRGYFASDAVNSGYQELPRFLQFRRTGQLTDVFLA